MNSMTIQETIDSLNYLPPDELATIRTWSVTVGVHYSGKQFAAAVCNLGLSCTHQTRYSWLGFVCRHVFVIHGQASALIRLQCLRYQSLYAREKGL